MARCTSRIARVYRAIRAARERSRARGYDTGAILDGRNRLVACITAGVEPSFVDFVGDEGEALDEVLCRNLQRRDLTESQRAAIAAEAANMQRGGDRSKGAMAPFTSATDAAGMLDVSVDSVKRAKRVRAASPTLHEAVKDGDVSVRAAVEVAKRPDLVREVEQPQCQSSRGSTPTGFGDVGA